MTKRTEILSTFEEVAAVTADLVAGIPGAQSFEVSYDITNRKARDDEDTLPTDTVRWIAVATVKQDSDVWTYQGTALIEPGGRQAHGITYACIRLLESLGVNTHVVDMSTGPEPSR